MATILTDSPSYDEATNIGLFVFLGMLLVSTLAFLALPHVFVCGAHHNESLEMGLSAQFTSPMPLIQTEDGSRDSTPEDSLSVRSVQASISHLGDTDSEWLDSQYLIQTIRGGYHQRLCPYCYVVDKRLWVLVW